MNNPTDLRFDGKVAIITGAGNGLGKSHAKVLAKLGASILVNDLGTDKRGEGSDSAIAEEVASEIRELGGDAIANNESVLDGQRIVEHAMDCFGAIDIVVNNAGILRDKSFHKLSAQDWEKTIDTHLNGAFKVSHAAWPHLREQNFGRIIFTTSMAAMYGNFGQANYSAAKSGIYGLTKTLAIEGMNKNIGVNAIAPIAGSRMTEGLMPPELLSQLTPDYVSPMVAYLCHESCKETGSLFEAGAGWYSQVRLQRSNGFGMPSNAPITINDIANHWDQITDFDAATYPDNSVDAITKALANLNNKD